MDHIASAQPRVLVLVDADEDGAASNAVGLLFEDFVGRLLARYGYVEPRAENVRTTVRGIEIDLNVTHRLTRHRALVECKAYANAVRANYLQQFIGRLTMLRYDDTELQGFFVALPRLVAEGDEQARHIMGKDTRFRVLNADDVVDALREQRITVDPPSGLGILSDPAVVITVHGVYSAAIELDPIERTARRIVVWGTAPVVPAPVVQLISDSDYGRGVPVSDASPLQPQAQGRQAFSEADAMIVTVNGSGSDFEYQLPASPQFFIGRKSLLRELANGMLIGAGVLVLNAQSGWGKSSLALRLRQIVDKDLRGHALILDARTATARHYVTAVLRRAAVEAEGAGMMRLGPEPSWASLASALTTLAASTWEANRGPLVVFFDQFENVFRDAELTREFRDLAVGVSELGGRLVVGFAWKTDLVDWTEGYPYQLRDEIRANATVITLPPLDAKDVDTLLRRLETRLNEHLVPDLRQRLREYSQGLPWLLKKLAAHLIREVTAGATQEQLLSEALNVQNLFESDLAELQPLEREAIHYIARFAPVAASDVMERVPASIVQSLLNRRLVVQVGERLDTYWDTFRDFLNTGRIPIEDSYILRQGPRSVARLLSVIGDEGVASVPTIAQRLATSENGVFNLSRELRLMGVTSYEPNRVRLANEIWSAQDREGALRERVATAMRRHKAFTVLSRLIERATDGVTLARYARELPSAFPAVDVASGTWFSYARVFVQWFHYARLVRFTDSVVTLASEVGTDFDDVMLLGVAQLVRVSAPFPQAPPTSCIRVLLEVAAGKEVRSTLTGQEALVLRDLIRLGALERSNDGVVRMTSDRLVQHGMVQQPVLRELLEERPGCREALLRIETEPGATPHEVGEIVRAAYRARWSLASVYSVGKHLRSWARAIGISTVARPSGI